MILKKAALSYVYW